METGQRPRPSLGDLDAVTLDAHGTLVTLRDPIRSLGKALAAHGVAPERALHIGDQPVGGHGAAAARMWFEPAPIGEAIARWT